MDLPFRIKRAFQTLPFPTCFLFLFDFSINYKYCYRTVKSFCKFKRFLYLLQFGLNINELYWTVRVSKFSSSPEINESRERIKIYDPKLLWKNAIEFKMFITATRLKAASLKFIVNIFSKARCSFIVNFMKSFLRFFEFNTCVLISSSMIRLRGDSFSNLEQRRNFHMFFISSFAIH